MKARKLLVSGTVFLLTLILQMSCAKSNKDLIYGTWINEKMALPKTVQTPEGYHDYPTVSATTPIQTGSEQIVKFWTDSEGNVWFQTYSVEGGAKYQTLQKVSKNGTVREMVAVGVDEFDPKWFPTKVAPGEPYYHIWYRVGK